MEENAVNIEAREDVIVAYQEIMNKLKVMKSGNADGQQDQDQELEQIQDHDHEQEMDAFANQNIIELASRETADEIARNLAELKLNIMKSLDDIKSKLTKEQDKFDILRKAISQSEADLLNVYEIKNTVNALSALIIAKNEKSAAFERELTEYKRTVENEKSQMEKERIREQNDYIQKRDSMRKREQDQYEIDKRALYDELYENRRALDEEYEIREASLNARENEHQQLKDREAKIVAREQEYSRLKEKEAKFPEELKAAVQKSENAISEQLTRKFNYDLKVAEIEWSSEKTLLKQKIDGLQQQLDQLKALKDLYS